MRALRPKRILLIILLGLSAVLLTGCRVFSGVAGRSQVEGTTGAPVTLGITIAPTVPEEVGITWEPESVSIEGTEITVTYDDSGMPHIVTVTVQLQPD